MSQIGPRQVIELVGQHQTVIEGVFSSRQCQTIIAIAQAIKDTFKAGGCVFVCGNGGSAADAQHIAAELVGRLRLDRAALPAIALTVDSSVLTAVANDMGFDQVFSRQVQAYLRPGDLLWVISTSGRSPNVLEAAKVAKACGGKVIAFVGPPGSPLEQLADLALTVPIQPVCLPTCRIQEAHQLAYHIICELVESGLKDSCR